MIWAILKVVVPLGLTICGWFLRSWWNQRRLIKEKTEQLNDVLQYQKEEEKINAAYNKRIEIISKDDLTPDDYSRLLTTYPTEDLPVTTPEITPR